ncbi:MAG: acyltransferase [Proteobacteria bacterium]|nr:acyltransferase [Pseudomonadota bacterium]
MIAENPSGKFRPDIEGLRAIAILLVVASHAGVPWLAGGFIGVDVFFVLSGFLITGKLVQEISETGRLRLLTFYVRRLRRLLPALLVMLLVVGLASRWLLSPTAQPEQFFTAQMAALWLSNFHFALGNIDYFSAGSESNLYLHTWSLGVEEQFYLVWPAIVLWMWEKDAKDETARLKSGMAAVALLSLFACIVLTWATPLLAFYVMPMRAWQFALGALAWLLFFRKPANLLRHPSTVGAMGILGLAMILASALWLDRNHPYPGIWATLPTAGTVLMICSGSLLAPNQWVGRLLSLQPLQWIGRVSYSWYLWHWPVLLLGFALTGSHTPGYSALLVGVSLVLATISYQLVEAPMRHWKKWQEYPRVAVFVSLACMAIVCLADNHWIQQAHRSLQAPSIQRYVAARVDAPRIYRMGCDDWYFSAEVRICAFGPQTAKHTAILIGDSHAGQWFPAVEKALEKRDWRLLVITKSSCPMVEEPVFYARIGRDYVECTQWRHTALQKIKQIAPDLLLIGSTQYDFTQKQWTEGTAKVLGEVSPVSGRVFLLVDTPKLSFDGPDCLMAHALRPEWLTGFRPCSTPSLSPQAAQVIHWLEAAAGRFPNVTVLDMTDGICPAGLCRAKQGDIVVYRDYQHLTGSFAATLAQPMSERLFPNEAAPDSASSGVKASDGNIEE